ncbi:3'-5' exonuclease [Candidatus Peregrinibacteria bacterium]|nr:3'-5' exonuclease [Candidatus Peregrinibacteria bacterium]
MKIIVFDTETTGMPATSGRVEDQPYIVQFAAITYEYDQSNKAFKEIGRFNQLIKSPVKIPENCTQIHGITDQMVEKMPSFVEKSQEIYDLFKNADMAVAHNLEFDKTILDAEFKRSGLDNHYLPTELYDTMKETKSLCKLPGRNGNYKSPKLMELHQFLFGIHFDNAHNAIKDVEATGKCIEKLLEVGFMKVKQPQQTSPETEQFSLF